MAALSVNGTTHQVDVDPNTPLLWVLRETIGLTGTKYGCGIAQCGACTVHVDGIAMRSCSVPLSAVDGRKIATIEGLAQNGALHKVQQAWLENDVPQCGYCQCGMIMAVAALLKDKPKPTDADIDANITNICRCGTFQQVRMAIHAAANAGWGGINETHASTQSPHLRRERSRRGRRACTRSRHSLRRPASDPRCGRHARGQRLGGDPPGRHGCDPRCALRDGSGHPHRPRPVGRRRARMLLVESDDRISNARSERGAQARVG